VHLFPQHEGKSARHDGPGTLTQRGNRPAADNHLEPCHQPDDVQKADQSKNTDGNRGERFHVIPPVNSLSRLERFDQPIHVFPGLEEPHIGESRLSSQLLISS